MQEFKNPRHKKFYKEVRQYIKTGELGLSTLPKENQDTSYLKSALLDLAKKNGCKVTDNDHEISIMSNRFYKEVYPLIKAKQN
jgi:hypothetical protein